MKRRELRTIFSLSLALLLGANASWALGSVVAGGGNASNGGTVEITADTAGSTLDGFLSVYVNLDADKSYACTLSSRLVTIPVKIDTNVQLVGTGAIDNTANAISLRGDVSPQVTASTAGSETITDNRIVITPTVEGQYVFTLRNSSTTDTAIVRFECMETTLYGGYNTNANPFNFLELTNTTNATISGSVKGYNYDGSLTADSTFSIPANNRFDLDLHSAAGANKYGVVVVTHDGPWGALQGAVSQYSGTTSDLTLRATVPLKPREQTF